MEKRRRLSTVSHSQSVICSKDGTIVVCGRRAKPVWLSGIQLPSPGSGVFSFEARGTSDIDVLFSSKPDSVYEDEQLEFLETSHRAEYEVVIGSHCNTKSVIRKRGVLRASTGTGMENKIGNRSSHSSGVDSFNRAWNFEKYWIGISNGVVVVGKGNLGDDIFLRWEDPDPIIDKFFIGISSWKHPVVFRYIEVAPMPEKLINRTEERVDTICNFLYTVSHNFNSLFQDICFESSDKALFPFHAVIVSAFSNSLRNAIQCAMTSYHVPKEPRLDMYRIYFFDFSISPEVFSESFTKRLTSFPRIALSASSLAVAMFLQLLYGIGHDGIGFTTMKSRDFILQVPNEATVGLKECESLLCQWQVSDLFPFLEESEHIATQSLQKITYSSKWKEHLERVLPDHFRHVLETCWLSDVTLVLSKRQVSSGIDENTDNSSSTEEFLSFPTHRLFLASQNSYFRKLFCNGMREASERCVNIAEVDLIAFKKMLKSLYWQPMCEEEQNLPFSEMWQIYSNDLVTGDRFDNVDFVRNAATQLRAHLKHENIAFIANLSLFCRLYDVLAASVDFISSHFMELCNEEGYLLELEEDCLCCILSRTDLIVEDEDIVVRFLLKWLERNKPNDTVIHELLAMVRWHFVEPSVRREVFDRYDISLEEFGISDDTVEACQVSSCAKEESESITDDHAGFSEIFEQSSFSDSPRYITLLPFRWIPSQFFTGNDRYKWLNLKKEWYLLHGETVRMTCGEIWIPFVPTIPKTGAIFYLSCYYGHKWGGTRVNPTNTNRFSKLESIVEPWVSRSSCAHPAESGFAWFAVDFGVQWKLACSMYSLAHDGSESNFLRNWKLQGSKDGRQWTLLKEHRNDQSLHLPLQHATWKIENLYSQKFFRYFRVVSSRPNNKLTLGSIEFYGRLRNTI
eukprot:jgi/Galph1/5567/GphlegSOOS_G4257.1